MRQAFGVAWLGVTILTACPAAAQIPTSPPAQATPPRDRVPPPRVGTSGLKGRVIDAATGAPVARARVRIQGGGGPRPSVLTDSSGRFAFGGLPAGPYSLTADKSTYMAGRYPEAGRSIRSNMKALMLAEGEVVDNVTVSLFHGASISGRVVDAHGDPVESATVRVMPLVAGRTTTARGGSSTNDLGEFRLARLEPGSYLVLVSQRNQMMGPEEPIAAGQPSAQPLPTYFPNALSIDQAQPITVARGESISGIEVALAEGYAATVIGSVVTSDGQPVANGFVNARMTVKGIPEGVSDGSGVGIRSDGTFRMQLAAGDYSIDAHINQPFVPGQAYRPDTERFGSARMSLAPSSVENVTIVVGRGATATGRIVFEGATSAPPIPKQPIYLPFNNSDGQNCRSGQPQIAADWTFRIEGLAGVCSGVQTTTFGRWTLKAVMHNGENLLERQVTFETGQSLSDVQLIFTDKRTELTFQVSDERGQATRDYVAIVFPVDKARWTGSPRYLRTYAPVPQEIMASRMATLGSAASTLPANMLEQMRREILLGLPAGDYYVVAVDDIEPEASRDPRVLEQLMSSASRVTVSDDAPNQMVLRRFKLSEVVR
jgi:Carboxypeptidase regulatory-like domain